MNMIVLMIVIKRVDFYDYALTNFIGALRYPFPVERNVSTRIRSKNWWDTYHCYW